MTGLHIAQIGTGRVGRPTAYTIMCSGLAGKLTVCDTKPGLAKAFGEELHHATVSLGTDIEIIGCERDEEVQGADIILVSAGEPRLPGVQMSRRDLALKNAIIVRHIAEATAPRNPKAKYVVITNPVDAMAMIFKKYSGAEFVISTGTNLESLRFRSKLARNLGMPVTRVQGWVGGEHGDAAVILWSTVKANNVSVEGYAASKEIIFSRNALETYMKEISRLIIDNIGGTEYGPAASFRDIVRAIAKDTRETLCVATPWKFEGIPEPVHVSVPLKLGSAVDVNFFENLIEGERKGVENAARAIYATYKEALEGLAQPK
ncbi:MAG TPA: malate dehydrogenase [Candidatus Bathyarchaeia archaeon]|nr:malate dehydrogenase [Candidatus Bathyarchaeia archaeon]